MANLAQYTKHVGAGIGRMSNLIFSKGEGSWLTSISGERYLDFTSGIGVTSTGHCHPKVVKAAQEQAANLVHAQVSAHKRRCEGEEEKRNKRIMVFLLQGCFIFFLTPH